jgi:hypothetical protein
LICFDGLSFPCFGLHTPLLDVRMKQMWKLQRAQFINGLRMDTLKLKLLGAPKRIIISTLIRSSIFNSAGEIEADWLSEVGLGEFSQQWRQGKSLPENDIGPAVQKLSLKPHQVWKLNGRNGCARRGRHVLVMVQG